VQKQGNLPPIGALVGAQGGGHPSRVSLPFGAAGNDVHPGSRHHSGDSGKGSGSRYLRMARYQPGVQQTPTGLTPVNKAPSALTPVSNGANSALASNGFGMRDGRMGRDRTGFGQAAQSMFR
jgi:hypothetical protein